MEEFIGLSKFVRTHFYKRFKLEIPFAYKGEIKTAIDSFKFYRELSAGDWLLEKILEHINIEGFDTIVPVPSHCLDNLFRGYETMSYLGYKLSQRLDIDFIRAVSKPIFPVFSRQQKRKSKKLRETTNLVFKIDESILRGRHILLIDDIFTTGNTVKALVDQIISMEQVKQISVFVVALV